MKIKSHCLSSTLNLLQQRLALAGFLIFSATFAPADVIVDNLDSNVTITGSWTPSTYSPGYYDTNYLSDGDAGRGTKNVKFTPALPSAGNYQVYAWWVAPTGNANATNTTFNISTAGGSTSLQVSQKINGSQWVSLGVYNFAATGGEYVQVSNTSANGYVIADAVRFEPMSDIIMDNADPTGVTIAGSWTTSTVTPGYYDTNYIHDGDVGSAGKNVTFTPTFPDAGTYQVYAWWTAATNRASNVTINVVANGTTYPVVVNQKFNGGQWVPLGSYSFAATGGEYVEVTTLGASGYVIADAVKFTPVTSAPATPLNDFLNSMGINTHVDSNGHSESVYEPMFKFTGIRNDRDDADHTGTAASLATMHTNTMESPQIPAGVMVNLGGFNLTNQEASAGTLATAGALLSLEGPNEPNNFHISYNGVKGGGNALTTALAPNASNILNTGLSVNTTTGVISGTPVSPAAAGTYGIALSATNSTGTGYATLTIMLNANSAIPVISSPAAAAATNSAFSYQIAASHSPTGYNATGLPLGLSVDTTTGVISGTPTPTSGTYPVALTATNGSGSGEAILTITINATAGIPVINSPAAASATLNSSFTYSITPTGATSYAASASWVPVAQYQRDLYAYVGSTLPSYPVFSSTIDGGETANLGLQFLTIPAGTGCQMPDGTPYADYAAVHNYVCTTGSGAIADNQAWNAADPLLNTEWDGIYREFSHTWLHGYSGYSTNNIPTLPRVTTETGWQTSSTNVSHPVTEDQQGKLFLNLYLAQYKRGYAYTFLYEIMDGEGGFPNSYGIYNSDSTAKLAATYIHNFTTIMADTTSAFSPGSIDYWIVDEPPTVHDMLMKKSDGTYFLIVWDERVAGGTTTDTVTVNFGATATAVNVYDPTVNTSSQSTLSSVNAVTLTLSDHPLILELTGLP